MLPNLQQQPDGGRREYFGDDWMVSERRELGDHRLGALRPAAEPATAQPPVRWLVAVDKKTTVELTEMSRIRCEVAR
jgi:hypothetical protein